MPFVKIDKLKWEHHDLVVCPKTRECYLEKYGKRVFDSPTFKDLAQVPYKRFCLKDGENGDLCPYWVKTLDGIAFCSYSEPPGWKNSKEVENKVEKLLSPNFLRYYYTLITNSFNEGFAKAEIGREYAI